MPLFSGSNYADDRLYVLELRRNSPDADSKPWLLVTRENIVNYYPPYRVDQFKTYEEAIAYLNNVAPQVPLISLNGKAPDPLPSIEEFEDWVAKSNFRPNYNEYTGVGKPFFPGEVEVENVSSADFD
jgi:hypothetical protein